MDTRGVEAALAKKYGYKPLPAELSSKYRSYFKENIPEFLNVDGGKMLSADGVLLCYTYDRIVIGDYGAFIEFSKPALPLECMPGQEYRMYDSRYKDKVKYDWLTTEKHITKVYHQKRTVKYADYKVGKYYVSVHEVRPVEDFKLSQWGLE